MLPQDIEAIAEAVIRRAEAKGLMIATAESCTGGLVSGALTAIAGSVSYTHLTLPTTPYV